MCPEGYSRHFADLYFRHGDSSCYDECECSSDANYATICNKSAPQDAQGSWADTELGSLAAAA